MSMVGGMLILVNADLRASPRLAGFARRGCGLLDERKRRAST
jgi:hypothetical protein